MTELEFDNIDSLFKTGNNELGIITAISVGATISWIASKCTSRLWLYDVKRWKYELDGLVVSLITPTKNTHIRSSSGYEVINLPIVNFNFKEAKVTKKSDLANKQYKSSYKFEAIKEMIRLYCDKLELEYKIY